MERQTGWPDIDQRIAIHGQIQRALLELAMSGEIDTALFEAGGTTILTLTNQVADEIITTLTKNT